MVDGQLEAGSMAAVGLTWDEVTSRLPKGIDVVCHNAEDSVTISGMFARRYQLYSSDVHMQCQKQLLLIVDLIVF